MCLPCPCGESARRNLTGPVPAATERCCPGEGLMRFRSRGAESVRLDDRDPAATSGRALQASLTVGPLLDILGGVRSACVKVSSDVAVPVESSVRIGPQAEEVDLASCLFAPLAVRVSR